MAAVDDDAVRIQHDRPLRDVIALADERVAESQELPAVFKTLLVRQPMTRMPVLMILPIGEITCLKELVEVIFAKGNGLLDAATLAKVVIIPAQVADLDHRQLREPGPMPLRLEREFNALLPVHQVIPHEYRRTRALDDLVRARQQLLEIPPLPLGFHFSAPFG